MAIIKSMHLKGFKSFAKPLDLQFGNGFNCVIGPNGSGKSVSQNTEVLLSSGKIVKIGDLVEERLRQSKTKIKMDDGVFTIEGEETDKILSLNPDTMCIDEKRIDAFIRRKGEPYLYEIKTRTGKKATTTGCHPVMIFRDGKIISEVVENLKRSERIATPREIKIIGEETILPKIPNIEESEEFYYFPNKKGIGKIKKKITKDTSRLFGYILGDGNIAKSNYIQLTNMDEELLNDYKIIAEKNNLPIVIEKREKSKASNAYIYSSKFADFIINIFNNDYKKEKKHIPEQFMLEKRENLAALISALFDCDATVDKNNPSIEYSTMSEKLCDQVQTALLRFGLVAIKKEKRKYASNTKEKRKKIYYYLYIDGKENLKKFYDEIGFLCRHKKERILKYIINDKIPNPNLDVLPKETNEIIKKCARSLGIAYKPLRKEYPRLAAYIENRCHPTRDGIINIIPIFYDKLRILHDLNEILEFEQRALCEAMYIIGCSSTETAKAIGITRHALVDTWYPEMFQARQKNMERFYNFIKQELASRTKKAENYLQILENLAASDIYWDEIIEINKVKGEKYVYDLSIPDHHNFIANNIIVHNSNIMDAMCFVLGKLSAKSMRAERSSNLIYNGGKTGAPLKEAEVSLVFTNDNEEFPIKADEVKLTRIIKQSGNSIYKINDQVMTRQQVLELLAAAKIDPEGHNIILQGDIVAFMEMKTENRRLVIEEIAGITVYEDKKNRAMGSLDKVESQLNDATLILKEREVYLRELKKDKEQAEKYKELEKNIKSNKATYLNIQINEKQEKLDEVHSKIKSHEDSIKKLEESTKEIRDKIDKRKKELEATNKDIEQKGEKEAIDIQENIEKLKTNLATNTERLATCKGELSKLTERKKQLISSLEDTKSTVIGLEESKKKLIAEIKELKENESKQSSVINQIKSKLGFSINTELDNVEEELEKKLKEYQILQEKNQRLLQRKFKLDADISLLNEKITSLEQLEKTSNSSKTTKELDTVTKDLQKRIAEDTVIYNQLINVKENYARLNEDLFRLQTQKGSIKASSSADFAIKKIKELKNQDVYGTISELGEVDKKFATALEVAAGPRIKSLVVKDDKVAAECIKILKDSKAGIATFLPMNKIRSRNPSIRITAPGVYGPAIDLIEFDPRFKEIFAYVFAGTLVVENIEIARKVGIGKARMVTLEGDLMELSGAMIGGYRAKLQGIGFSEKNLTSDLNEIAKKLDKTAELKRLLEKRKEENENVISELRNKRSELEADLIKIERTSSGMSVTELKKQRDTLKGDAVYSEFTSIGKLMDTLNTVIQKLKVEKSGFKNTNTGEGQTELEKHEAIRLKTRENVVEKNTQIKNIEIQINNMYNPENEKIQQLIKNCDKEHQDFTQELKTLASLIQDQNLSLNKKESEKSRFQKEYKDLFASRNKITEAVQKMETSILLEAGKEKGIWDKINELSIIRAKITAEIEALNTEFEEFKGISLRRGLSIEELKLEIKNFESMLVKIGNVNMRALEVYEEINKEYQSLIEKRDKLATEREDVLNMIVEIEKNKKDIFMKTYKELDKNFSRIFLSLSRKGEANLELENKEDPLSAGVDIRVRITGNKFLDIKSLSGGEKTMAALAFIFAIQEYQPMAFYLLDEVDAALDKKNSELLSELVSKYSQTAQYIMISHNDNVITQADCVYGVSMHQTGISKVVSLKL